MAGERHKGRASLAPILSIGAAFVLAGCSVFGVRSGYEQPAYDVVESLENGVEIRRYQPRVVAEVSVPTSADEGDASGRAFRILAAYIFGENRSGDDISMTAPVEISEPSEKIGMTAPVAIEEGGEDGMRMRFFLPTEYTLDNAPRPNDPRVELRELPAETIAALRFSDPFVRRDTTAAEKKLRQALEQSEWQAVGAPVALYYDPPWTIPFLRRNEVAISVSTRPNVESGTQ